MQFFLLATSEKEKEKMKRANFAVSVAILVVLSMVAPFYGPATGWTAQAAPPQVLRVGLDGEPTHLDPTAPSEDLVEYTSSQPIFDALLEYSYDGKMTVVGNLAESWEWVDPQTFKFTLRKGVKFHNGKELTTADVKYTFDRIKDPKTGSRIAAYLDAVKEVEVVDDSTGIIHLSYPFAPLETYVLEKVYIVPEGAGDTLRTAPVGTGAFKFKEWVSGEKVVLVKNTDYWKPGKPMLDELVFQFFPQYQTALNSFRAGNTDIILWLNNADADPLKKEAGVRIEEMGLYGNFYIGFNMTQEPFNNQKVREAIKYGVDKALVLDRAQMGYGSTVDINESPDSPFYVPDFNYKRDVEKAKQLLAEAGYPNGFSADLIIPLTPTEGPIGEAAAFSLSEIGLNITPVKLKVPEYIDQVFTRKDYPFMVCGYAGVPDPDFFDYTYLHSKGSTNVFHYNNPQVDDLLTKARSDPNMENRKQLYKQVFDLAYNQDVVIVWLINEYRFTAIRDNVKDFKWNKSKLYEYEDVTIQ
jgi:peptide/nickel transport system substrate-binding protein